MPTRRIQWIDSAKALAIFLVVMGHFLDPSSVLRTYIYTFHMHLFFFVSGFVFRKQGSYLQFVGANTIIIYLMELYPQAIFGRLMRSVFHVDNLGHATFGYAVIYALLTILMLVPCIYIINRYLPFIIGRRKRHIVST